MKFTNALINLLFLELTLYMTCAQDAVVTNGNNNNEEQEVVSETLPTTAVEDDDDAVSQLQGIQTLDQFLPLLRQNGNPVTLDDMFSEYTDSEGKEVIQTGGRMAVPDDCSPRNSTVRLNVDTAEHNIIHFPRCTKIERCGGCCASPHLQCRPLYTERVSLKVLKAEVPYSGSPHLTFKGFAPAIVERHVTCRVVCTLTAELCGPRKVFQRHQCKCRCQQYLTCNPPKVWDPEECQCKCQATTACCNSANSDCGLVFDSESCQCIVDTGRMHISASANVTDDEIESYYSSRNLSRPSGNDVNIELPNREPIDESSPSTSAPTTTTSTTTTTTTTTAATTPTTTVDIDPCLNYPCPRFLLKVRRNNICVCQPRRRRFRGSRNRG